MLRRHAIWKFTIFLFVLFCTQPGTSETVQPMGSVLFDDHGYAKKCFIQSDIALLSTRLKFQNLLPNEGEASMLNDEKLTAIIRYFYAINEIIEKMSESNIRQLLQQCFYDLLGSYLKHQILPITKFSFYSGNVTFSVAQNVLNLYERCKELLDTNGNGWSDPIADFSKYSFTIEPLDLKKQSGENETMKACGYLAMNQNDNDNDEDMLVPLPKIETESDELLTIWLPFKRKRIFNVNAKESSFILLRYFVVVSQCYSYQGLSPNVFNRKFKKWIMESVLPFLDDESLYPTFGAVLRILETVKDPGDGNYKGSKKKSSSRRERINSIREDYESFDEDYDDADINLWISVGIIVALVLLALLLIICFCVKMCKNQRSDYPHKKSFKQKVKELFTTNTHNPERDEYYQYSKSNSRGIVFENEKPKKSRWFGKNKKPRSKDKIDLPLLGEATDTEDEIVLHQSNSSSKMPKVSKTKFAISESSDEARREKKSSLKTSPANSFNKIQSKK